MGSEMCIRDRPPPKTDNLRGPMFLNKGKNLSSSFSFEIGIMNLPNIHEFLLSNNWAYSLMASFSGNFAGGKSPA